VDVIGDTMTTDKQSQSIENQKTNQQLVSPPELTKQERWIVRLDGVDQGPFSSSALYPKLLTGELDPETMLLDQERFSRCRLKEIPEFQQYLHLHNTMNPILLEEQRQKEREEYWETTGKKRVYISLTLVFVLIIGGLAIWRFVFYQSKDVYMSDGDFLFSMSQFQVHKTEGKKEKIWKDIPRQRKASKRDPSSTKKDVASSTVDFSDNSGDGDGIPREKLHAVLQRNIRSVFHCFTSQMERDSQFTGGEIIFTISGNQGSVRNARLSDAAHLTILNRCVQRIASSWSFPQFSGNAVIHYPIYVQRRSRW
jgi:hypothetical protein